MTPCSILPESSPVFRKTDIALLALPILVLISWLVAANTPRPRLSKTKALLENISLACEAYRDDFGCYPHGDETSLFYSLLGDGAGGKPELKYLTLSPEGIDMKKALMLDEWGLPIKYACPGKTNAASFDLWSFGEDGLTQTDDDVVVGEH